MCSFKILSTVAALLVISVQAHAQERKLTCHLSLPGNTEITLDNPVVDGKAKIQYTFDNNSDGTNKSYVIEAEVWGFQEGNSGRKAGYLSATQVPADLQTPRNYAVNHCELKDYKEACSLELVATLNGVGMQAKCDLPKEQ